MIITKDVEMKQVSINLSVLTMAPSRWPTGPQIALFFLFLISFTRAFEVPILDTGSSIHPAAS